ncbi:hypothetical protein JRF99_09210, partial [Micrococcus luteus]|nr:hypothetical protein [Micrococcus luteus]
MTTPDRVHLDHAATTTVRPTALAALAEAGPAAWHDMTETDVPGTGDEDAE